MRFLGIGDYNSLGDMHWRLHEAGHEVRVYVHEEEAHGIFRGLVERTPDWRAELDWIRAAGDDGIIVFETATMGTAADELRRRGFRVVGGSAFGDRLENDRAFGQQVLRECGVRTAPTHAFADFDAGIAFLRRHPGRWVFKVCDSMAAATRTYVGMLDDGSDVIALLEAARARERAGTPVAFVLMRHIDGIEVGIGAYFDGEEFLQPACIDWEHKRFFAGDLGELTGEMGTVVSYRGAEALFELTLARLAGRLRAAGHRGYLNINTIVDDAGVWPLEFTCRFGYPGYAVCEALHADGWDVLLRRMATGGGGDFATRDGFAVGVVITVPPFPYEFGYAELSKGAPIFLRDGLSARDRHLHLAEVELLDGRMVTSGSLGYIAVVTGTGADVDAARRDAYARTGGLAVANMRYRIDIGERLARRELEQLRALGYWR